MNTWIEREANEIRNEAKCIMASCKYKDSEDIADCIADASYLSHNAEAIATEQYNELMAQNRREIFYSMFKNW